MEICNRNNYTLYFLGITGLIITALIIAGLLKGFDYYLLFMFVAIMLPFIFQRFTDTVKADKAGLTIEFHQYFRAKVLFISRENLELKIKDKTSIRGNQHTIMEVYEKGKMVYEVNNTDGFEKKELTWLSEYNNSLAATS